MDGAALDADHQDAASIAATGFGLTALCIGAERGWITRSAARERTLQTLQFFADRAFHQHGWFYHWLDAKTGKRRWQSEVSSIDTALLLAGVLTARQYFNDDPQIQQLATKIYERVDFRWMLNGNALLLSHGWKPETGFLKPRWDTYSEDTISICWRLDRPRIPFHRHPGTLCGATVIATRATVISPLSAFPSSCINMRTPGLTIATGVKPKVITSITLRTQLKRRSPTARSV